MAMATVGITITSPSGRQSNTQLRSLNSQSTMWKFSLVRMERNKVVMRNARLVGAVLAAKMRLDILPHVNCVEARVPRMKKFPLLLVVFAFCAALPADAQRFYVKLSGKVTDHFTGDPVKGVLVRLLKAGKQEMETSTRGDGTYNFTLDRGWRYAVWFSKENHVTKHINIDTEEVPAYPDVPFYEMDVQMTLFQWIPDFDFSTFDQPLGEASFKQSVRNMSWDIDYTERMRPMLARAMDEYEKTYYGYYKRRKGRRPAKREFALPVDTIAVDTLMK